VYNKAGVKLAGLQCSKGDHQQYQVLLENRDSWHLWGTVERTNMFLPS